MTDLLSQIEAAAALGAKATQRPWTSTGGTRGVCNADVMVATVWDTVEGNRDYIVAAANLPLSAIAKELRAKDAEIERLRRLLATAKSWMRLPAQEQHTITVRDFANVVAAIDTVLAAKESRQ